MSGVSRKPLEGAEELGMDVKDTGLRGRHPMGLGGVFQGSGTVGTPLWVREVGDYPPHGQVPGEFSAQNFQADYGEISKVTGG